MTPHLTESQRQALLAIQELNAPDGDGIVCEADLTNLHLLDYHGFVDGSNLTGKGQDLISRLEI